MDNAPPKHDIFLRICISEIALCRNSGLVLSEGRNRVDLITYDLKLGPKGQGTKQWGGESGEGEKKRSVAP